jgi:sodium/bile acid cotransporter 7
VAYDIASATSKMVVAVMFFLHGVKISPQNFLAGLTQWRLQVAILASTFVIFPILGLLFKPVFITLTNETLYQGILFVCVLPSTVQSAITFTSIARGNVAAAICAASASSILGVLLTPLLVALVLGQASGGFSVQAVIDLFWQLILPFAAGQVLRPHLGGWLGRHKSLIGLTDKASVLFIIYVSFSQGASSGLWDSISLPLFLKLTLACGILLALALAVTGMLGRRLGFDRGDRVALLFCGSKKTLMAGVPMANIIFPAAIASIIILPLMIFHQIQLMVCAQMAHTMGSQDTDESA